MRFPNRQALSLALVVVALVGTFAGGLTSPVSAATTTSTPGIACIGDGVTNSRVQPVYLSFADRANRYASAVPVINRNAAYVDEVVLVSSLRGGGTGRHVRWVTDSSCRLSVLNVRATSVTSTQFAAMRGTAGGSIALYQQLGLNAPNRSYLIFADPGFGDRGWAQGVDDINSGFSRYATVYNGSDYTGQLRGDNTMTGWDPTRAGVGNVAAHELVHALGGVSPAAPHATPGRHCTDGYDLMCYDDGTGQPMTFSTCPKSLERQYLDCGQDDYFSTGPQGWLASHPEANVANSPYLGAGASGPFTDFVQHSIWVPAPSTLDWTLTDSNVGASAEFNEPAVVDGFPATRTVWRAWRPTTSGTVTVKTATATQPNSFDTLLSVTRGCIGTGCGFPTDTLTPNRYGMTRVGSNDNASAGVTWSRVTFTAVANTTYYFAVDSKNDAQGNIVLRLFPS